MELQVFSFLLLRTNFRAGVQKMFRDFRNATRHLYNSYTHQMMYMTFEYYTCFTNDLVTLSGCPWRISATTSQSVWECIVTKSDRIILHEFEEVLFAFAKCLFPSPLQDPVSTLKDFFRLLYTTFSTKDAHKSYLRKYLAKVT